MVSGVIEALTKAASQLGDRAVLAVLAKSVVITLVVFVIAVIGFWLLLDAAIEAWIIAYLPDDYSNVVAGLVAVSVGLVAFWILFRVVAVAVLQFFADEVVAAVEARHYPEAAERAKPLPFAKDLANSLKGIGRTVAINLLALPVALVLLVTGIGPAVLFLGVNAWLLGRELTDMAWLRHCAGEPKANPVPRAERVLLGLVVAAIMLVPFANLLAPILGAAAGTHLTQRAIARRTGTDA